MDLSDPGIELGSPVLQADSLPAELPGKPKRKSTTLLLNETNHSLTSSYLPNSGLKVSYEHGDMYHLL